MNRPQSPLLSPPANLRPRRGGWFDLTSAVLLALLLHGAVSALAEDGASYRSIALSDLFAAQTDLDEAERERLENEMLGHMLAEHDGFMPNSVFGSTVLRLEDHVEGFLASPGGEGGLFRPLRDFELVLRFDEARATSAHVDLITSGGGAVRTWSFQVDPEKLKPVDEPRWQAARRAYYQALALDEGPGTSLFQLLANEGAEPEPDDEQQRPWLIQDRGIESTFAFFSGGRAVAENLALDQELFSDAADPEAEGKHPLDEIRGVTVPEFDWAALLDRETPELDVLANVIPHDQHVLFVPTVADLRGLLRTVETELAPWIDMTPMGLGSGYVDLGRRYLQQMGLSPEDLDELAPMIDGIAVTGYDPFFALGTDVTLLMRSDDAEALLTALTAHLKDGVGALEAIDEPLPPPWLGDEPSGWRAWRNPSRTVSAHVVKIGGHVVLSNSEQALYRLHEVSLGMKPSLASLDEFKFFRQRYRIGEPESAFLYLSDATIRRWTGPAMRIGASRRTRALAAMTDLNLRTALGYDLDPAYLTFLGLLSPLPPLDGQRVHGGRMSESWGTASFLKPLVELELGAATDAERTAYEQWRDVYESSWGTVFDPIALRVDLTGERRKLDLSVIPLINSSVYQSVVGLVGKAELDLLSRTRGEATLLQLSMAVDPDGELFRSFTGESLAILPGLGANPLGWMGGSVSIFIDQDPVWRLVAMAGRADALVGGGTNALPVGARLSSRNRIGLGLFLTAIKGFSEISAPGLLAWEPREHAGQSYVSVGGREQQAELFDDIRIHYAPMPGALLVALSEPVLHRAIEREQAHVQAAVEAAQQAAEDGGEQGAEQGEVDAGNADEPLHGFFEADPAMVGLIDRTMEGIWGSSMQMQAWKTLPLLNTLRRKFPEVEVGAAYERWVGTAPACPGGLGFRWNADDFTYESVAYGHPGSPRDGGGEDGRKGFEAMGAGLRFEHGGLRAQVFFQPATEETAEPIDRLGGPLPEAGILNDGEGEPLAEVAALWPTEVGASFRYRERHRWADGDGDTDVYVMTVTEAERDEESGALMVRSRSDYEGDEDDEDGWVELFETLVGESGIMIVGGGGEDFSLEYTNGEVLVPPAVVKGLEFSAPYSFREIFDGELMHVEGNVVLKVTGLETVEVEAGEFVDCVRIDWTMVQTELMDDFASVTRMTGTTWYKEGIGMIRTESTTNHGDSYSCELLEVIDGAEDAAEE